MNRIVITKKILVLAVTTLCIFFVNGMLQSNGKRENNVSELVLQNIEALALGETGSGDCGGCIINSLDFCKFWGWGGCIGDPYLHPA